MAGVGRERVDDGKRQIAGTNGDPRETLYRIASEAEAGHVPAVLHAAGYKEARDQEEQQYAEGRRCRRLQALPETRCMADQYRLGGECAQHVQIHDLVFFSVTLPMRDCIEILAAV